MFSANDRIRYLEKEVALFREEAIKLYDKLGKKEVELTVSKEKMADFLATANRHEN